MARKKSNELRPVTLAVDIGGTGIKVMALDPNGKPLTERLRQATPYLPTPARVLAVIEKLREQMLAAPLFATE